MSVHVEWMDAASTTASLVVAGEELPDGQISERGGIALSENEVVMIEGSVRHLMNLAHQIMSAAEELALRKGARVI